MMVIGNKLWMACFSGIACMDLQTSQIISFGKEDGFPDMPVNKAPSFFTISMRPAIIHWVFTAVCAF